MRIQTVVKVGGSLLADASLPQLINTLVEASKTRGIVIVPGGGPFADAVRDATERQDPGQTAAHWMAVLAMDQFAHLLAGLAPASRLVGDAREIVAVAAQGRLPILAPFAWLRAADPLPHGWHVTSDSIAAWVAGQLGAGRLVLLKAVDGAADPDGQLLPEADRRSPALAGLVDEYLGQALRPGLDCWIVNGRHPERLSELLSEGRTRGTQVR